MDFTKKKNLDIILPKKKLIVFDLDGTLAESKSKIDTEMSQLIVKLLTEKKVAVIGGGKYGLFKEQLVSQVKLKKALAQNLYLFPTTATAFYKYQTKWHKVYEHLLTKRERVQIKQTFEKVFQELDYKHPKKTYGPIIEDRGSQVTFSVYGQDVVAKLGKKGIQMKDRWRDEHTSLKLQIAGLMQKYLPKLEVRAAGHTSIDVTKKGIDKAYGLRQIEKYLKIKIKEMVFIGDAIFPGGNDYAVTKTKVDYIKVSGPKQTKKIIKYIIG